MRKDNSEVDTAIDHSLSASKTWALTDRDVIAQSFLFLFGGHETMSTTFAFANYLLATHADAQEKCFQEINALIGKENVSAFMDF